MGHVTRGGAFTSKPLNTTRIPIETRAVFRSPRIRIETAAVIVTAVIAGAIAVFYYVNFFNWPLAEEYIYATWYRLFFSDQIDLTQILLSHQGPHPMAVELGLGLGLMRVFGIGIDSLTVGNYLLLLAAAILLAWRVSRDVKAAYLKVAVWPLMLILVFHPIQTDSLLKPADLGWLLVSFLLVTDAVAIERFRTPMAAVPGAILGAFCFAQGSLLSLIAALHSLLLPRSLKSRTTGAAGFATMFAAVVILSVHKQFGQSDAMDAVNVSAGILPLASYFVELLGSLFGARVPAILLVLGGALLVTAAAFVVWLPRKALLASDRIALCLIAYSMLAVGMFAVGRYHFDLPWVLARFHAAVLVAPFAIGVAILALRHIDRGGRIGWAELALVLTSVISALPYGIERARESRQQREAAMMLSCRGELSALMLHSINGVPLDDNEVEDDLPELRPLCRQTISRATMRMLPLPPLFTAKIQKDASSQAPLETLWLVYLYHFDLQNAMPFGRPDTPKQLLDWGRNDARNGSGYDPNLKAFQAYFSSVSSSD
jgi:hypothetical protein